MYRGRLAPRAEVRGQSGQETTSPDIIIGLLREEPGSLAGAGEEIITTVIVEGFHMLLSHLFLATTP